MDFHVEQLIKKRKSTADNFFKSLTISISLVLCLMTITLFGQSIFATGLIIIGIIFIATFLVKLFDIEYEYELTNNILDIDKIIAERKRKRIITIDFSKIEQCRYVNSPEYKNNSNIKKVFDYSGNPNAEDRVFIDLIKKDVGMVRVIIRPCERIRKALTIVAPKTVKL